MPISANRFSAALLLLASAAACGAKSSAGTSLDTVTDAAVTVTVTDAGEDARQTSGEGASTCDCCGTPVTISAGESCGRGVCDDACGHTSRDAGEDATIGPCDPPPTSNSPRCPADYVGLAANGKPCTPIGLVCAYPGEGDPAECGAATAMMWCRPKGAADAGVDAGADAGEGEWVVAQ